MAIPCEVPCFWLCVLRGGGRYGSQGLQRWFMTHLFNAYGASVEAKELGGDSGSAYEEVVHRFMLGLVGVVVGE